MCGSSSTTREVSDHCHGTVDAHVLLDLVASFLLRTRYVQW